MDAIPSISGKPDLKGKVAIVTGASRGIGSASALALAREGADVVLTDILPMDFAQAQVAKWGNRVKAVSCNVTDENQVSRLVASTIETFGRIDVLVHCAGICLTTPLEEETLEEWERVLKINLTGTFLLCREVISQMKLQKFGKVVCVGSVAGKNGGRIAGPHYTASKGGVHSLVRSLALHHAVDGIHVNGIAPGPVNSEMTRDFIIKEGTFPLGRMGEPEDIAEAVVFLSSQASNWITGQVLDVNGGLYM